MEIADSADNFEPKHVIDNIIDVPLSIVVLE